MALHPTTRILMGLSLILTSSALSLIPLTVAVVLLAATLWSLGDSLAWRWLKRARLLLIIPPLVSGYAVAGDGVFPVLDLWSPTWQGLAHGGMQSLRLLVALLGLRLLVRPLSRDHLTVGLATLLAPLQYLGADIVPLVRRLTLTLSYLDQLDGKRAGELLRGALPSRFVPVPLDESPILAVSPMDLLDVSLIALLLVIGVAL